MAIEKSEILINTFEGFINAQNKVNHENSNQKTLSMEVGNLDASVTFAGGVSVKASWEIYKLNKGKRGKKVYGPIIANKIRRALAPGVYQVVASVGRVIEEEKVTIVSGKTIVASIKLLGSKVKLLTTASGKKLKKTWVIKNIATNDIVHTSNVVSTTITLPPGKYIAEVTSGNVTKKKSFVVKLGRTNTIFLAME